MTRPQWSIADFNGRQGTEVGISDWFTVDQDRIDGFARTTEDEQYIHVDPERAKESPFGGTIAHGFLSLSLLSAMAYSALPKVKGETTGVNYGFGSIRFLAPVRSGRRVRGRFKLKEIVPKREGQWLATYDVSVETDGEPKPAIVAEWMILSIC